MSTYRVSFFPHHDDTWVENHNPYVYKGIPGARMEDFLTNTDSRYDDVYSYFFEDIDVGEEVDWTKENLVMDYMEYLQYYYKKEHDCVRAHHRSKCCYLCKHFITNGKNRQFLGSCIRGMNEKDFPRKHVGNYHAKHGFETCDKFEMKEYYLNKKKK